MTCRVLIMGLPGSGKTTLAQEIVKQLGTDATWFNADAIREQFNDWDFSEAGRIRQAGRMRELADTSATKFVIADFVCPLPVMRNLYAAHYVIWMDTIKTGRFADTNRLFVEPDCYDLRITQNSPSVPWGRKIAQNLLEEFGS